MKKIFFLFLFTSICIHAEEKTFYCEYKDFEGGIVISIDKEKKYITYNNKNFSKDWEVSDKNITVFQEPTEDIKRYNIYYDKLVFNFYTGEFQYTWQHSASKNKSDWNYILPMTTYYLCKEAKSILK